MTRVAIPTLDEAPAASQPILNAVQQWVGFVPNLFRLMSISPSALAGAAGLQSALGGTLDTETRMAIAMGVSQANSCSYCMASHCFVAARVEHMTVEEITQNLVGRSLDEKRSAAVQFAVKVVESRGHVSDADYAAVRNAGFTAPQIVEIVALAVQFQLTNYINNVFQTEVDFPSIDAMIESAG